MKTHRFIKVGGLVAAALFLLVGCVEPPPPPSPDPVGPSPLFVTPNTGLVDGQKVAVTGYGWDPYDSVNVVQCGPSPFNIGDCDLSTRKVVTANAAGEISTAFTVSETIDPPNAPGTDCTTGGCVVEVASQSTAKSAYWHVLFGPAPTLTVTPDTDLGDGQTVLVNSANWPPGIAGTSVTLYQCDYLTGRCVELTAVSPPVEFQPDGTFTASVIVHRVIDPMSGPVDCATNLCSVAAVPDALVGIFPANALLEFLP